MKTLLVLLHCNLKGHSLAFFKLTLIYVSVNGKEVVFSFCLFVCLFFICLFVSKYSRLHWNNIGLFIVLIVLLFDGFSMLTPTYGLL